MGGGFEPLPPYSDPRSALKIALPALRPAERISVTTAAERNMLVNVSGQWKDFDRRVTPYMVEPTDMSTSRQYRGLSFCGPSQSGKTQMLQAIIAHTITSDPCRIALFQMTRDAASLFELEKIAPMVRNSPKLRARQATGRGSDTIFQKLFMGGTHFTLDWPSATKLASTSMRRILATDFDRWDDDVGGEGDPWTMMLARVRTAMSRGMAIAESSPGKPITEEDWRPKTPHDSPPVTSGILSLYPAGTRGRWYWCCPLCGAEFEPTFKRLIYPASSDPAEAGEAARMQCPHCKDAFDHVHKRELNEGGRWLHEATPDEDGQVALVPIDDPRVRKTEFLSYWLDGASAAFASWSSLVSDYVEALRHFEATGDEKKLRATVNTGQAQPFLPRTSTSELEVTVQGLKDKAQGVSLAKGVAPAWTRYITVSVDVQGSRFEVGATAWGDGGRHQPIDRFAITTPLVDATRALRPGYVAEDWTALEGLSSRVWPVDGQGYGLQAVAIAVDMQGEAATTDNAYAFYRGRRRASEGSRWFLTRGSGGLHHSDRVWLKAPETARGKRKVASDLKILNMATDRLKDAVATSLKLVEDGQNIAIIPEWMEAHELAELAAERRAASGWEKRRGLVRNESLDHLVQARALHIILRGEQVRPEMAPEWALLGPGNRYAVVEGAGLAVAAPEDDAPQRTQSAPRSVPGPRGWIGKRERWL